MIQIIRGFKDILPGEVELWQEIEQIARNLFEDFGFCEIRIPMMERTELFARSIGEDTDIVEKEMYTFEESKGRQVTLRPEATASVTRAYIQNKLYAVDPVRKFYTIGPMFRRERPQKGRYRQFYQINAEVYGIDSALIDAQLIYMLTVLLDRLAVTDAVAHINSLGCAACRPAYKKALSDSLATAAGKLCANCTRRSVRNPLRVLDCKVESCREALTGAPALADFLCARCATDFTILKEALDKLGVPYVVDSRLVRGLDYYTRATFEIQTHALGAQNAVAGGGRYDGLVKTLGGPDQPATGFAIGFDRLAEIVAQNRQIKVAGPLVYIAALGKESIRRAFEWQCALGVEGIRTDMDFSDRSLKSQMKRANRSKALFVLIVGEKELSESAAILRNMQTKDQESVALADVVVRIKQLSKR